MRHHRAVSDAGSFRLPPALTVNLVFLSSFKSHVFVVLPLTTQGSSLVPTGQNVANSCDISAPAYTSVSVCCAAMLFLWGRGGGILLQSYGLASCSNMLTLLQFTNSDSVLSAVCGGDSLVLNSAATNSN